MISRLIGMWSRQNTMRFAFLPIAAAVVIVGGRDFTGADQPFRTPASAEGASTPGKSKELRVTSLNAFSDEFDAQLASDGRHLWAVVNGLDRKGVTRLKVLRYLGGRWQALRGEPRSTTDTALQMVLRQSKGEGAPKPCVGDTSPTGSSRVRCLNRDGWSSVEIPRAMRRDLLTDLIVSNGQILALFIDSELRKKPKFHFLTRIRVAEVRGSRLVPRGPTLRIGTQVIAKLTQHTTDTRSSSVEVGITSSSSPPRRWMMRLKGDRWLRSKELPRRLVGGSMPGGPVRSGSSIFFPVNQIEFEERSAYLASVYRQRGRGDWQEVGNTALNTGSGDAQGTISPVGNQVWATWSELNFLVSEFGGMIPTRVFAAKINPTGTAYEEKLELWSGKTVFPVSGQAISYRGKPAFFYMRQRTQKGGMIATVAMP